MILNNQNGHGQVPSAKDVLLILLVLITLPISLPIIILREKFKK
jgi:hypothetical protein